MPLLRPICAILLAAGVLSASACRSPENATTRMSVGDFEEVAAQFAAQLAKAKPIEGRTPQSDPPMVIAFQKVTNLSGDIMTPGDQWAALNQVRGTADVQRLWDDKRVAVVLTADQTRKQVQSGIEETRSGTSYAVDRHPTHIITATLHGTQRSAGNERTDLYVWQFEMFDLATNQLVWSGECLIKRRAFGSQRD